MSVDDGNTPVFYLTNDMKRQFKDMRDKLDEILETFEILEDKELMERIRIGRNQIENEENIPLRKYLEERKHE